MIEGTIVGGTYQLVRPIGRGGMGAVYDAIHVRNGRRVAVKLIAERLLARGEPALRRFTREARAAAAVDSQHVVQVLDSGEDESSGVPFIVMEYLEGEDLRTRLRRERLPVSLAVEIASQACLALVKAHAADIIHRDLKPANLFLARIDERLVVKLLDFGVAKLVGDGASADTPDLTATGDLLGSPPYMSPEQLRTPRDVDHRTDLWSLGVVLYEMLAGKVPTHGIDSIGARVYAICNERPPSLREKMPDLDPAIAAVVDRALEIDRDARFADAQEMLAALRRVGTAEANVARPRRRRLWAVAAIASLLVAIGAVALATRGAKEETVLEPPRAAPAKTHVADVPSSSPPPPAPSASLAPRPPPRATVVRKPVKKKTSDGRDEL